jgi:hypothetical protein
MMAQSESKNDVPSEKIPSRNLSIQQNVSQDLTNHFLISRNSEL